MTSKQIVVIGGSAGGLEAMREIVAHLPADFAASICVVLHTSPQSPGVLADILGRAGPLPATNGRDRDRLEAGHIHVAPPDCHLLIEPGMIRVTKGPRENRFRPAVDPLFRSAAQVFGPNAIGVVLTGNLDDGTAGLWTIKQLGGTAIVQDPGDAMFADMPRNAATHVDVDYSVRLADIAPLLVRLTSTALENRTEPVDARSRELLEVEVKIGKEIHPADAGLESMGEPSPYACPECHGVLLQLKEGGRVRFRCHTGHAYSVESLLADVSEGIEDALWNAIRTLEEGSLLLTAMAAHLTSGHDGRDAERLLSQAQEARRHSDTLRQVASEREPLAANP